MEGLKRTLDKQPILLIGAGGHSSACLYVMKQQGVFQIVGLMSSVDEKRSGQLGSRYSEPTPVYRRCANNAVTHW
jgi:shikimate 5-dehydrogenase